MGLQYCDTENRKHGLQDTHITIRKRLLAAVQFENRRAVEESGQKARVADWRYVYGKRPLKNATDTRA